MPPLTKAPNHYFMPKDKILVLGAGGQIGQVLTSRLRQQFGTDNVVATDLRPVPGDGPFEILDAMDGEGMAAFIKKYNINQVYHLVAILSAVGEKKPVWAWDVNMKSLFNVLEIAKDKQIKKVFFPSSIAVFGAEAKRNKTPQYEVLIPDTVYGISKVAAENWCQYYFKKYDVDVRSVRYPGIIGYETMPGGGTTDYAVDIFHEALKQGEYTCFLKPDTPLPMMYMADAIRATLSIMDAPAEQIKVRTSYNIAAISFTPAEIAAEIQKHLPDFKIQYKPDFRQAIADSWPASISDAAARKDWGWKHEYNLRKMVKDMLENLSK